MAPNPQCAALAAAQAKTGISYAQIAASIGTTEQQVIARNQRPTESEFKAITRVLGISDNVSTSKGDDSTLTLGSQVSHSGVHATA